MYNRISIVGGSGSRKSTLCNILSKELHLPAIHIDGINYNTNWIEIDKTGCKERLNFTFIKYVATYNKKKRHIIVDNLKNISMDKVLIFKKQKDLNKWLKEFIHNKNLLVEIK